MADDGGKRNTKSTIRKEKEGGRGERPSLKEEEKEGENDADDRTAHLSE